MKIAIVGGIGAGKSTMLETVKSLGISTLSADDINKELLKDEEYIAIIAREFPSAVENGVINKDKLSKIIFSDTEMRKKLNSLAHPRILEKIRENQDDPLAVEIPLLLESGAVDMFDEIVLVQTPKIWRVCRVKRRRHGKSYILRRVYVQANDSALKAVATRIIKNNKSIKHLQRATVATFKKILKNYNSQR